MWSMSLNHAILLLFLLPLCFPIWRMYRRRAPSWPFSDGYPGWFLIYRRISIVACTLVHSYIVCIHSNRLHLPFVYFYYFLCRCDVILDFSFLVCCAFLAIYEIHIFLYNFWRSTLQTNNTHTSHWRIEWRMPQRKANWAHKICISMFAMPSSFNIQYRVHHTFGLDFCLFKNNKRQMPHEKNRGMEWWQQRLFMQCAHVSCVYCVICFFLANIIWMKSDQKYTINDNVRSAIEQKAWKWLIIGYQNWVRAD